jgi:hypothetical protein
VARARNHAGLCCSAASSSGTHGAQVRESGSVNLKCGGRARTRHTQCGSDKLTFRCECTPGSHPRAAGTRRRGTRSAAPANRVKPAAKVADGGRRRERPAATGTAEAAEASAAVSARGSADAAAILTRTCGCSLCVARFMQCDDVRRQVVDNRNNDKSSRSMSSPKWRTQRAGHDTRSRTIKSQ